MTKSRSDLLAGVASCVIAGVFWLGGRDLEGISRVFPTGLEVFIGLGGLLLIIQGLARSAAKADGATNQEKTSKGRVGAIALSSIVYTALIPWLGFYVSSLFFLGIMAFVMGRGRKDFRAMLPAAGFAVTMMILVYLTFSWALQVPTPSGVLL